MKLKMKSEVDRFLNAVNACEHPVWLTNENKGIRYNLKSALSLYCGIAALIGADAEGYELFCYSREDEGKFFRFFNENPQVVA